MLLFKAPGDFSMFLKTVDLGPKRHSKNDPLDHPKTHSKIDTRNPKALKRLYTKRLSASECYEKSTSKIRTARNRSKIMIFKKGPKCDFGTLQTEIAQALRFSVFRQLSGQAGGPIGARNPIGWGGLAGRPKISNAKCFSGKICTIRLITLILL